MSVRGIRGATTVEEDTPNLVLEATQELLLAVLEANPTLEIMDIASVLFTVTSDLSSEYPAKAARGLNWNSVPLMCAKEIPVPNSLNKCIRILIHWNTMLSQNEVRHVYLHEAAKLRPDLIQIK